MTSPLPHITPTHKRLTHAQIRYPSIIFLLGTVLCVLSLYPILWSKDGAPTYLFDTQVYYGALSNWWEGNSLYDWYVWPDVKLYPFTYPPVAAWLMSPMVMVHVDHAEGLITLASALAVGISLWWLLRSLGVSARSCWALSPWLTAVACHVIEPVNYTLRLGQINALLLLLVVLDMCAVPSSSRFRGALSGVAAAIKLTPAIAVLIFLLRRDWRAAVTMTGTSILLTGIAWILSPAESARFFFDAMSDTSRAGDTAYAGNQNLMGAFARLAPDAARPLWIVGVLAALAGVVVVHQMLSRALPDGDQLGLLLDTGLVMGAGLLISPITWSHHWVWVLVIFVSLGAAAWRWQSQALATATAAGLVIVMLAPQFWFSESNHVEVTWPLEFQIIGSSYSIWLIATMVMLAWTARSITSAEPASE